MDRRTLLQVRLRRLPRRRARAAQARPAAEDAPRRPLQLRRGDRPRPRHGGAALPPAADEADRALRRPQVRPFRAIRFRDDKRLFNDDRPFQVDLLPPGFTFQDEIEIYVVKGGVAEPVAFSIDFFDFHPTSSPTRTAAPRPASPRTSASAASASATR